jgi:uncharacterized membrane protein
MAVLLLDTLPYLVAYRASRRLASAAPAASPAPAPQPAAELRPRRYGDYVPWYWEILPLLIIAATTAYLAVTYAAAPAIIPTHFGLDGQPNQYSVKTIGSYFALVWIQLGLEVLLTSLALLLVGSKAVPGEAEARFRRAWIRFLYVLKLLLLALLGALAVGIAYSSISGILPPVWFFVLPLAVVGVVMVGSLVLALRTGQGGSRLGSPDESATDRLDDRYWILGIIYVNRNDPSIFVERRFGVGWTLNFGNPRGIAVLLAILAVPLLTSLLVVVLLTLRTG